jgi:hypothetical protein
VETREGTIMSDSLNEHKSPPSSTGILMNNQLKELAEELDKRHLNLSQKEMLEVLSKPFTPSPKAKINLKEWRKNPNPRLHGTYFV